eukprot:14024-Heterococcus_DN1.PRE.2
MLYICAIHLSRAVDCLKPQQQGISTKSLYCRRPEWEDAANATGGEWSCRERLTTHALDTYWENLVLGLIGETIDWGDEICGARVVDKSRGKDTYYRYGYSMQHCSALNLMQSMP